MVRKGLNVFVDLSGLQQVITGIDGIADFGILYRSQQILNVKNSPFETVPLLKSLLFTLDCLKCTFK
jgi:hypothetical protein